MEPAVEKLVEADSQETKKIKKMILKNYSSFQIIKVDRVENSFLKAMYLLKKEEYLSRYGKVEEKDLFHVTSAKNVKSIINNNFDWRRVLRGKFGIGTSFSDDAEYANHYANQNIGSSRAFIITKVLVSNQIGGHKNLKIPKNNYDTTTGNGKVYVKFGDNETLPMYVAYYKTREFTTKHKTNLLFDYNNYVDYDYDDGANDDDYYYFDDDYTCDLYDGY
uniref:Poly [ADP-ribose] polymerase n=1 Tax=Cuerna arida TaxID=1464854 RepID=A0A1B6GCY8_9HEMI